MLQRVTLHMQQPVFAGQVTMDLKSLLGLFLVLFSVIPPVPGRWDPLSPRSCPVLLQLGCWHPAPPQWPLLHGR